MSYILLLVSSGFAYGNEFDVYPETEKLKVSVSKIDFIGFDIEISEPGSHEMLIPQEGLRNQNNRQY